MTTLFKHICLTSLLLQCFICFSFMDDLYFDKKEFHELKGNAIQTTAVFDDFQCMLDCKRSRDCSAINLANKPNKDGLYECILLRHEANKYGRSLNPSRSYHFYTRVKAQCTTDRCKNGGMCQEIVNNDFRCHCPLGFMGKECETKVIPKNCFEVHSAGGTKSGVYTVDPEQSGPFKVYCDQKAYGGGWTVMQKRMDGSVDFYRGWHDYKTGFGNLTGEFWLGLDKIYQLTNKNRNRLRVELEYWNNDTAYAEYDFFAVTDEKDNYSLIIGNYTGTAGDSLINEKGSPFTTKDRDNDIFGFGNCAVNYKGAWWYKRCYVSHLNGVYGFTLVYLHIGIFWNPLKNYHLYSVKRAEMKIRPV